MRIFVLGTRGFPGIQGGVEKHCEELYVRLAALGADITVFARLPFFPKTARVRKWKGIKFIYLWCPKTKGLEAVAHTFLASFMCLAKRPDIAHFHNIGPSIFMPLLKLCGIRTVLTYHSVNYQHRKWNWFGRLVLRAGESAGFIFSDRIIVISKHTKAFLGEKYPGKGLEYVPNGVDISVPVQPGGTLQKYGVMPKKYIFAVCRFTPEKGVTDLIDAFERLDDPGFKLVIAGDADHETDYSRQIRSAAAKNKDIVLTGFITGDPLRELYANAGLFVLPSYQEGLPIALLEALSFGLPVLASDIPASREVPLPENRYFRAGDIAGMSGKIAGLFNEGIKEEERQRYMLLLKDSYDWDKIAASTLEVYKSL